MNSPTSARPITVWLAVLLLVVLAVLSAVGGYLFNLAGADDPDDYLVGGLFVLLGLVYLASATRLPAGSTRWYAVALVAAVAHGLFNAVVKVGIEGETESLMFVALTTVLVAVLVLPASRRWFSADGPDRVLRHA